MSPQQLGLIIGGLLPALFYGVSSVFAKVSTTAGMPVGPHLICIGVAISLVGVGMQQVLPGPYPSTGAIVSSSMLGLLWGLGTGCVALGLIKYQVPLSKLVPLYNMNTLITVVLALIVFLEWKSVDPVKLSIGAVLVIVGGLLVSQA